MPLPRRFASIAFDLFGTLVHVRPGPDQVRELERLFADSPHPDSEVREILMTRDLETPELLEALGLDPGLAGAVDAGFAEVTADIKVFEEVPEVLTKLHARGQRMAVISNLARPYVAPAMALLPDVFEARIFSCEVGAAKPAPAIFEALATALDLPPEDIVVVGDSERSDCKGARRAGMEAVLIRRGPCDPRIWPTIRSLRELL